MIPCKECLVLSTCRQREKVDCPKLHEWILKASPQDRHQVGRIFKCYTISYFRCSEIDTSVTFSRIKR